VETELAEALNVSRTPLREAISRLAGDHLVRALAHGGVEVVDTQTEMDEIYFIREALEGCAARLAAERINDEQLAELDRLVMQTEIAPLHDVTQRARINGEFHDLITQASGSERLIRMVDSFREFFMSEEKLANYSQRESEKAMAQHRELVDALREHDGKRAERLIRRHLELDRRRALKKGK
jgi:DNA-binding GntR family transcriptional regulator